MKIRVNVRFGGQIALGKWITCKKPLRITVTAMPTFIPENCVYRGGKNMNPHGHSKNLDFPISDIWILKKDREYGQPWCKWIKHYQPNDNNSDEENDQNKNIVVVSLEDDDVQPTDFYYIAVRQKGEKLRDGQDEYMAYIGPVFTDKVQ